MIRDDSSQCRIHSREHVAWVRGGEGNTPAMHVHGDSKVVVAEAQKSGVGKLNQEQNEGYKSLGWVGW